MNARRTKQTLSITLGLLLAACARDWKFLEPAASGATSGGAAGFAAETSTAGAASTTHASSGGAGSGNAGDTGHAGETASGGRGGTEPLTPQAGSPGTIYSHEFPHRIHVGLEHVCALRGADGSVLCFGDNSYGQRGNGKAETVPLAKRLHWNQVLEADLKRPFTGAGDIHGGAQHTCVTRDREIWCWGDNQRGELAKEDSASETTAKLIAIAHDDPDAYPELWSGANHLCASLGVSGFFCWGENRYLQIDGHSSESELLPTLIATPGGELQRLSLGHRFTLGIYGRRQAVHCWGIDDEGQCGNIEPKDECVNKSKKCIAEPVLVPGLDASHDVFAGQQHACAYTINDEIVCWGQNSDGQVTPVESCEPDTPCILPPTKVLDVPEPSISDSIIYPPARVALGAGQTCALLNGQVTCWGFSQLLGMGSSAGTRAQQGIVKREDATILTDVVDIAAHNLLTCAITSTDKVYCWGFFLDEEEGWSHAHEIPFD